MTSKRLSWPPILAHAAAIVSAYDTPVSLRQLFYRLVARQLVPNTRPFYQRLSSYTAKGRRLGTFPHLLADRSDRIEQELTYSGPAQALTELRDRYRRDRTEGQPWTILLGVEKAGLSQQLDAWFTAPLGIPHVPLGGYASQALVEMVRRLVLAQGRPAALIYAGDHDPSGEDIDRDFVKRADCFDKIIRVALNADQLHGLGIPPNHLDPEVVRKLEGDTRASAFRARHGYLDQYEVDAIEPNTLRDLYQSAINGFWDVDAHADALRVERADRARLAAVLDADGGDR